MNCCYLRKPVLVHVDRGDTLRSVWLRAPPLRQASILTPSQSGCLTQHAPYEGGQRCVAPHPQHVMGMERIFAHHADVQMMVGKFAIAHCLHRHRTMRICPPYGVNFTPGSRRSSSRSRGLPRARSGRAPCCALPRRRRPAALRAPRDRSIPGSCPWNSRARR